jgi:hypothetical protein
MKIVNRETFLSLPKGTLFSKYEPCIFGDLCIKDESYENDFRYQKINSAIACNDTIEFSDKLFDARSYGTGLLMDFDDTYRDGMFDNDQLFAIWEQCDAEALLRRLDEAIQDAYDQ